MHVATLCIAYYYKICEKRQQRGASDKLRCCLPNKFSSPSSVLSIAWIEEDVKYDENETGGGTCTSYTASTGEWIESEKSVNWKLLVYRIDNAGASFPFYE